MIRPAAADSLGWHASCPLPPHLMQVLGEVADYVPPTAAATGRYSLKRACWHEFDPYYPHYTRCVPLCMHSDFGG